MKNRILENIMTNKPLTPKQILFIQKNMLPNFKCDCNICRFNLALYFDLVPTYDFKHLNSYN